MTPPPRRSRRVLHVVNRLNNLGDGIANVCVDLACRQADERDVVAVATVPGGFTDLVRSHGVRVADVDFRRKSVRGLLTTLIKVRRAVREFDPDIVHAHTLVATVIARVATTGMRARVVATVHNEYQRGVVLMGLAHQVVGVSTAVSEAMAARGIPRRKISTVLNGVVGSPRRVRKAEPVEVPDLIQPAIVAVGAVSHRKGADLLVEAARRLAVSDGAHTYLVGNLDWAELGDEVSASDAADFIHFVGFDPQPQRFIKAATVFVLASRKDPAPLSLVEATEAGVAIVAAAVDGVPELLDDGDAGVLVPADDADALTAAIGSLLRNPARRAALAERAHAQSQRLTVERVSSDYRDIYDSLLR